MEGNGIQPVMSMNPGYCNGGFFGNEGIWLFAILALMWGGGGNFFGNRQGYYDGRAATVEDLNNSANFTRLENQVSTNGQSAQQYATNLYNGICQLGYESAQQFGNLGRQLSECCCTTQRAIDGVNYNNAINTASINANTTAQIQRVLDRMCQEKDQAQQAEIYNLRLRDYLHNVVRYPSSMTYAYNANPFCSNSCCYSNAI